MSSGLPASDKIQIVRGKFRSSFYNCNNAAIVTKAFVYAVIVKIERPFLFVIDKVEICIGKFFDLSFTLGGNKGGRAIYPEAVSNDI